MEVDSVVSVGLFLIVWTGDGGLELVGNSLLNASCINDCLLLLSLLLIEIFARDSVTACAVGC